MKKSVIQLFRISSLLFVLVLFAFNPTLAQESESDCISCCEREVINTTLCSSGIFYGIWFETSDDGHFELLTSSWIECDNGIAHFSATATNDEDFITIEVDFSGLSITPLEGSPKENLCGDFNADDWVYYTNTTGTIVSENHGTFTIERRGEAFQVGEGANVTGPADEYGGSGWFDIFPGENFDGHYLQGDINIMLNTACTSTEIMVETEPTNYILECGDEIPEIPELVFTDPSDDELEVIYIETTEDSDCGHSIIRTWTAVNNCEQELIVEQTIDVVDTTNPTITHNPTVFSDCLLTTDLVNVTDNCDQELDITITEIDSEWNTNGNCDSGQLRTQTMGGWGINPNGNNPGVYLHNNFDYAFPNGLTIGCNNTLVLTSAQDVTDFLPSGSTASALPNGELINPGEEYNNVLAGQIVALTLSTVFDQYDPSFGISDYSLEDLIIQQGEYEGTSVSEILVLANEIIGTCGSTEFSSINSVISSINENFVDGTTNNNFLGCDLPYDCYLIYDYEVTAIDGCGNSTTENFTSYIINEETPQIPDLEEFLTVECDEIPDPILENMEDCFGQALEYSVTDTEYSGTCFPTIHRVWTFSNPCGNSTEFTQYITVVDTEAPQFLVQPEDLILNCNDLIPDFEPEVIDNCDEPEIIFTQSTEEEGCETVITRNWVATDQCGNQSSVSQTIIITDNLGPVFSQQVENMEIVCGVFPAPPSITATDICDPNITVEFEENVGTESCASITRVWSATDNCGNTSIITQVLTMIDHEAPTILNVPENITTNCNDIPTVPDLEAIDNCDEEVDISFTENTSNSGCEFTITRTWIAVDNCGNTAIANQQIFIVDDTAPVFLGLEIEQNIGCNQLDLLDDPIAVDNCSENVQITFTDQNLGSGCVYEIIRTYTATDDCGNSASSMVTFIVTDQEGPVFFASNDPIIAQCSIIPEPAGVITQDACGFVESLESEDIIEGQGCELIVTRIWTAIDNCANTSTFEQLILVNDQEAPSFDSAPLDLVISCDEELPDVVQPIIADNCDEDPDLTFSSTSTISECSEVIANTWNVIDDCGNSNSFTQYITITDNEAPIFQGVPANVTVDCISIPEIGIVTATDNCSTDLTIFFQEETITGECPYIIRRSWTAIDDCGNTSLATQDILVEDLEDPILTFTPEDITVNCGNVPEAELVFATDNCGGFVLVEMNETSNYENCVGEVIRTWTASDLCGNQTSHTQVISVIDEAVPFFTYVPENIVIECNELVVFQDAMAMDLCGEITLILNEETIEGECPNEYTMIRSWTAIDPCGNEAFASQIIEVVDNSIPVFSEYPDEIYVSCDNIPSIPDIEATDNCNSDLDVIFTEEILITDGEDDGCVLSNAQSISSEIALWLPSLGGFETDYVFTEEGGTFIQSEDGNTATITGEVYSILNPNQGFIIDIQLYDPQGWDEWSANGGQYKDDYNLAGDAYLYWDYYKLSETSKLIGTGIFEGSELNLIHSPSDFLFGFQVGQMANNLNDAFGLSGWFSYSGELWGQTVHGVGDVIAEQSCCENRDIMRTWSVVDCSGNQNTWTQIIHIVELIEPMSLSLPEDFSFDVFNSEGDDFVINFESNKSEQIVIDIVDINGNIIDVLYNKMTPRHIPQTLIYSKDKLTPGIFLFRIIGENSMMSDRELVGS